jgi:hypothetical protein
MHQIRVLALIAGLAGMTMGGSAQAPLPIPGQPAPAQGGRGGGRGQAPPANLPQAPTVSPLATISAEVTGPGDMFSSLMELPKGDDLSHFRYVTKEYWVSGRANDQPYRTRRVIRRPAEDSRFSGVVMGESMHPSGNAWMFHFTHTYFMDAGHIGWEVVTSPPAQFVAFNRDRYAEMKVEPGQAPEILAQVGAALRTGTDSPLAGLPIRRMVLAGTSASAGVLINYLPAHMVLRLPDMKPVFDGMLPTSSGATIRQIDVPMIQVPTMTEVHGANSTARQDGDAPGDQFRVYEFAGMPHLDSRDVAALRPDPCRLPISSFPMSAFMSVALHHLVQWVDKGITPPKAARVLIDRDATNDGSMMWLDEHGNPRGGIRNPYVDVPVAKFGFRNAGAATIPAGAHPWVALRGEAGINQLCGLLGYQQPLAPDVLRKLHRSKADYVRKVADRYDALVREGWALPLYKRLVVEDASRVAF